MHLRTIPFSRVTADAAAIAATQDSSHPSSYSQRFNTTHHPLSEILPVVPETLTFKHSDPPWTACAYTPWHPLIARSQSMTEHHSILIPSFLYEDLLRCHSAWISTGRITTSLLTDVVTDWQSTKAGKQLIPLLNGTKKWFIRLDQMSPKDSPLGGNLPSCTFEEVVSKLCSSMRAYGCLQREKEDAEREEREVRIRLVLNPWDGGMDPAREFRVFVPPPAARGEEATCQQLRISAVSQYRWHKGFEIPLGLSKEEVVECVSTGAETVLGEIVAYAVQELEQEIMVLLLKYGFTFDVILREGGSVQLVEINPFGALSGCGACLFNWVLDGKVLYGLEEAQFAITLDKSDLKE